MAFVQFNKSFLTLFLCLPSVLPFETSSKISRGFHRYKLIDTAELLLRDAIYFDVLNPAPLFSTITRGADYIFTLAALFLLGAWRMITLIDLLALVQQESLSHSLPD
jgi:hypothetical protein